jgi:hypothetical protein
MRRLNCVNDSQFNRKMREPFVVFPGTLLLAIALHLVQPRLQAPLRLQQFEWQSVLVWSQLRAL